MKSDELQSSTLWPSARSRLSLCGNLSYKPPHGATQLRLTAMLAGRTPHPLTDVLSGEALHCWKTVFQHGRQTCCAHHPAGSSCLASGVMRNKEE